MTGLGTDFMRIIGNNLRESDMYLAGAGKLDLAEHRSGTFLTDNDPLLLHGAFGEEGVIGSQDIYSIKRGGELMVSLGDFASAAGLAIKVNPQDGSAKGWFLRENQTFAFDPEKREVTIQNKISKIAAKDFDANNGDPLIAASVLERWFNVSFDYDLSALNLLVKTSEPFPIEAAYARGQKLANRIEANSGPQLPLQEPDYAYTSLPFIDTDIGLNVNQSPGQKRNHNENWSSIITGDYAGFSTKGYISGNSTEPYITDGRLTMGKQDPRADLLGPLHATSYSFGDVDVTQNAIIGTAGTERGVTINNKDLNRVTTKTSTQINGDSHPGWDVELYRNEVYIDIRHVGSDGRYDFGKVDLVVGDNDFKLLLYGPQGERNEEHKHVGVNSNTVNTGVGKYDVSLTENGRMLWQKDPVPSGPGIGAPHLAATYEYGVNGLGTLSTGLSYNNDAGTERLFTEAGLATDIYNVFYNFNVGFDTSNASYATDFSARRSFGPQSVLFDYVHNSEGFNATSATTGSPVRDIYRVSLNGPLINSVLFMNQIQYGFNSGYTKSYNGDSGLATNLSLTARINRVSAVVAYNYNTANAPSPVDGTTSTTDTSSAIFGLRGYTFGGSWRLSAQYQILPKKDLTGVDAEYSHTITDNLDSLVSLNYDPNTKLKTAAIGLNWITPKVIVSPRVQYDNLKNITANVNLHYGLVPDEQNLTYHMVSGYVSDSGAVSARIFEDKNGNGIFDEGDEPLEGAEVTALQGSQSGIASKDGIALLPNLGRNQRTDIVAGAGSSTSANGISLFKGVSIIPHPGGVTRLEFPIVESGEMDGQAHFINAKGESVTARGLTLALVTPDGRAPKTANSESDGYWSMSTIEPGIYYLAAQADTAYPGYLLPRLVQFKEDGTMLFGQDVKLTPGHLTSFRFTAENSPPDGANHARVIRPADIASQKFQLEVGDFHSRLAMTLAWYKIKLYSSRISGGVELAMPMAGMPQNDRGITSLVLKAHGINSIEQGAAACQAIGDMDVGDCVLNVITTYRAIPDEQIKPYKGLPVEVAAKRSDDENKAPEPVAMTSAVQPDVVVHPRQSDQTAATTATVSPALVADLTDYVAANPGVNRDVLKSKTVLLNLGSYNSRALLTVMWYKIKTRYTGMIGDAALLVRTVDSNASSQTGKYTLRAALPSFNVDDANNRCRLLTAAGQFCTVEVLPSGLQASR